MSNIIESKNTGVNEEDVNPHFPLLSWQRQKSSFFKPLVSARGFVFAIICVWMCFLPPSPVVEHTGASLPLIIGVNLRLSLAAGQWLTTLPVSQTLITTQVTHRPGNDWHEMETSLILWNPVELKWNISCGRDGGPIRGSLFGGWNCGGPRFHYISFYGVEILLASDKGSLSLHFHRFSISSFKTWQRATPRL